MSLKITFRAIVFILITAFFAFAGCHKDEFNTSKDFKLEFSSDTVIFDTVFTTIGSSMRELVIHNPGKEKINISRISLARGTSSPFRINIDGAATETYNDLEIAGNDSAYIFVKVTIDPNSANLPLIETDSIVFETNGNIQDVKLVAWGQDAYFHMDDILTGDVTLPDNKPHVVYGKMIASSGCNLKILAGSRFYFHSGSSLEIRSGASLDVEGTVENPVIFTGDRLEDYYLVQPGMWDGIWLQNGSKNISFANAEITNARTGIWVDSCGYPDGEPLRLHNCLIHNMINYGIKATKSKIVATNCQVTNCGGNVVLIENGGDYDFRNSTLARYYSGKSFACLSIQNYALDTLGNKLPGALTNAYFGNCIVTGSQDSEIELNELEDTEFNFLFDQCLVNWDEAYYSKYASKFVNCISNKDAYSFFIDQDKNNFQLDTLSAAINAASMNILNMNPPIILDRKGVSRLEHGLPDLGAYERVEKR